MKIKFKRPVSLLLAAVLSLSTLTGLASAGDVKAENIQDTEILDAAVRCDEGSGTGLTATSQAEEPSVVTLKPDSSVLPLDTEAGDSCGSNATWSLDSDGTLTISGSGEMDSLSDYTRAPWYGYDVAKIVVSSGITGIGNHCFECCAAAGVSLPSTLKTIGDSAFQNCAELENIELPGSVTSIGSECFSGCSALKSFASSGLTEVPFRAFYGCSSLTSVSLNEGLKQILREAFVGCSGLKAVTLPASVEFVYYNAFPASVQITNKNTKLRVFGNSGYRYQEDVSITGSCRYDMAYQVLDLVNEVRAENGVQALVMDESLLDTAMLRSTEISVLFSHTRPDGSICFDADPEMVAENVAMGQKSADEVMSSWMNSAGHSENILNSSYNTIGIGCFYINGTYYWTQNFGVKGGSSDCTQPANKDTTRTISLAVGEFETPIDETRYHTDSVETYHYDFQMTVPSSLSKNESSVVQLYVKSSENLGYLTPIDNKGVTFSSSNTGTATVDSSGRITGVGAGNATISASLAFTTVSASVNVTDPDLPQFVEIDGDWYYCVGGSVDRSCNDIIEGTVNGKSGWWYVRSGKVDFSYTGLAENSYGWWYLKNGEVDFSHNGVDQNEYGWWYVVGGKVQFSYTGVADYSNAYGWWYIENGKVNFGKNSVEQNKYGWWYVIGGKVDFSYTGVSNYSNAYGWWYIRDGQVDFSKNSVEQNNNGWWYVVGGKVDFSYTGVSNYSNAYGWWYVSGGKVDFSKNSVEQNNNGWWYVLGGKVQFGYTGVANYANSYGWWYVKDGKVDFSKTGIEQNNYGWWRVVNGKVDFSCNSVEENQYGWWYLVGGKVQFGYTGVADYANAYGWWYISAGKVDFGFTGTASNSYGTWYVSNGKVDFGVSGTMTISGKTDTISNGKVTSSLAWYEVDNKIYHAGGGYQGVNYTNSVEALTNSLSLGRKLIELDFVFTSDGKLVCQHEWDGPAPTYNEFMSGKSIGGFTAMSAEQAVKLMAPYSNVYLIVDAKGDDIDLGAVYQALYDICVSTGNREFLDRIVAQIYYEKEYAAVKSVYDFPNWVYHAYKQNITSVSGLSSMASFCSKNGIKTISLNYSLCTSDRLNAIYSYGCVVTAWTINSTSSFNNLLNMGVSCIYTDFL